MTPPLTRRRLLQAAGASAAAAALGPSAWAQSGQRPNVLVLVVDTLRADHVGAYGGRAQTPWIDALAREGLRFTHAYPEGMATVPARRAIMTGRRSFPFRDWRRWPGLRETPGWEPIDDVGSTFSSALRRAGYWTGYVTDNPFLGYAAPYRPFRRTFDRFVRVAGQGGRVRPASSVPDRELLRWLPRELRNPATVRGVRQFLANGGYWEDESRSWAARVYTAAARLLDEAAARRPFALVVDSFEPHEPWSPPRRYIDLYGDPDWRGPEPGTARYMRVADYVGDERSGPLLRRMRDVYAAEVTMTDRWLGTLVTRLHDLALERETAIVLVSDHGFLLGEHGWTGKIAAILDPGLIHVPLILVDPARRLAGESSAYFASTHDVAPTILSMAGVPAPRALDGADLSPLLAGGRPPPRRLAYGGYANHFYVRNHRWAMMGSNRGRGRKLFDLRRDPAERRDVAHEHPQLVDDLHERVLERAGGRLPVYRRGG